MIYTKPWKRNSFLSLLKYCRDLIPAIWPGRFPRLLRRVLLGFQPDFAFIVHPRRKEDIFRACGFFGPVRSILGRRFYKLLSFLPPVILGRIETPGGITGIVITSTWLPEQLLSGGRKTLLEGRRCLRMAAKLIDESQPIGLGGWWPIVTRRGLALREYAAGNLRVKITNGHCGTLCSLVLSIEKIATAANLKVSDLSIFILGAGRMGSNVARALNGRVKKITLFDKNRVKVERTVRELSTLGSSTQICQVSGSVSDAKRVLVEHHLCICSTSNVSRLIQPDQLPNSIVVLDDSRPEAFPRLCDLSRNIIVIEGGLLKIRGSRSDYDFGFGRDENVFGCLAEAYLLARSKGNGLLPTVGDVDLQNFSRMLAMLDKYSVSVGDFRSGSRRVNQNWLGTIVRAKQDLSKAET